MNDRPKTPQDDDVLSSVRRLVTDTTPLVLTPAQLVSPPTNLPARLQSQGEVHDAMAPIDEDVLHDLVREILTEELQGPYGEKLTRTIRKMVRAELGRALAERDLK
ncbi:hypothetical protein [Falsirhodobacter algicola]|uniref:Uncharacterized protein n=1 Tax=Falsirhodobacter algicola TaxID=2692330 RepID=A0A8J8SKG6_9RHOB|nr:hypothetical protein [Falsirhodobacter algicola]QUS35382.1 hypothetical protein GR316_03300 [Falsirhodobacter algicola]